MEKVKKTINFLGRLKWLGLFLGALMCILTQPRLGDIWSVILGTVAGGGVTVVSTLGGNVIVNVKDTRVAISKEMAVKIMV